MKFSIYLICLGSLFLSACASTEKSYCELLDEPVQVEQNEDESQ